MELPLSNVWKIDGKAIFQPSTFSVSLEDLEVSAERTADGMLHRERARQGVRKVSLAYDAISQEQIAILIPKLEPVYFDLTYPDPQEGIKTIECYCSTKSAELYSLVFYNGLWRGLQFNCIER